MKDSELREKLSALRVVDLKEELGQRDLASTGRKADLVARLEEYLKAQEGSSEGSQDGGDAAATVTLKSQGL